MAKWLLLSCSVILLSCQAKTKEPIELGTKEWLDSFKIAQKADSIVKQHMNDAYFKDTLQQENCPVKILSARPVQKEYSNYKDISLTYKNTSSKNISAIRFSWYGVTAFNDPADMGVSLRDGFGGGFMDDELKAGRTTTSTWNILSRNVKRVVKAWVTEVAYEDGTKWKPENN